MANTLSPFRPATFVLGEQGYDETISAAVLAAVQAGRIICQISPREWWVNVTDRRSDEWADYSVVKGNIRWSLNRINDILKAADIRDSFGQVWEIRSMDSLKFLLSPEVGRLAIEKAAERQGINIQSYFKHYSDRSVSSDVTISWGSVTESSRYGIGN